MLSRSAQPSRPAQGSAAAGRPKRAKLHLVADRTSEVAPSGSVLRATQTRAARPSADWVWSGLGIGAAAASASFAAYMLALAPGAVTPSGNFHLFARYGHGSGGPADRIALADDRYGVPSRAMEPSSARTEPAEADAVDATPTGTVPTSFRTAQRDRAVRESGLERYGSDGSPLPDFKLRNVFDGKALVESRSSLSVVKPGSVLDGAGRVLSIERRGSTWVVVTDKGLIAGEPR